MIDRIEELLGSLAAEEEDEERQEDVLALSVTEEAVPASPRGDGGEAGGGETGDRSGGRTAEEIALERPGLTAGETEDGGTGDRGDGQAARERGAVASSGLRSERSESGETPRDRTVFAESESLDHVANRRSVTSERRGAVVSSGLRSDRSESGEVPRDRTAFAESESLDRVANRRSVTTGEILRSGTAAGETGVRDPGDRSGGRTAEEIALEQPGLAAGEAPAERKAAAGELWKDGPVWTVRSVKPEIDKAQRISAAERTVQAEKTPRPSRVEDLTWAGLEWAAQDGTLGPTLDGAGRSGPARDGLEQTGLKGLYRQTVQGLRPAAPALPPEQTGRTARAQEPGSAASRAVDELDRAVRRDSRRYDGGMSIY